MAQKQLKSQALISVVIAIIGIILAIMIPIIINSSGQKIPRGEIITPKTGEMVERNFLVTGRLLEIPEDNQVWLIVKKDNLLWPKEPMIVAPNKTWSKTIEEISVNPGESFTLGLYSISPNGQKVIEEWFEKGHLTNKYPGMKEIKGTVCLDLVQDIKIKK